MALEMLGAPFQEKGLDAEGRVFCSPRPPNLPRLFAKARFPLPSCTQHTSIHSPDALPL